MAGERLKTALKASAMSLLLADATIEGYCGTRVEDSALPVVKNKGRPAGSYPQITFQVDGQGVAHGLPAGSYELRVNLWVETHRALPKTTIDTMELAVQDLLHGPVGASGVANLNAQGFDTKCRLCRLDSAFELPEPDQNLLHTSMTFMVILGTA